MQHNSLQMVWKYLVNKPIQAAGILEDNARGWKIVRKKEQLAEKRSFEGNCETLRTIFLPRALSSNIPASQEGVYLFYSPPINFFNARHGGKKEKHRARDNHDRFRIFLTLWSY